MVGSVAWRRYRDGSDYRVGDCTRARGPARDLLGVQFRRLHMLLGHGRARRDGGVLAAQERLPRVRDSVR